MWKVRNYFAVSLLKSCISQVEEENKGVLRERVERMRQIRHSASGIGRVFGDRSLRCRLYIVALVGLKQSRGNR